MTIITDSRTTLLSDQEFEGPQCTCGETLPWHLFSLEGSGPPGTPKLKHHCSCGRVWSTTEVS